MRCLSARSGFSSTSFGMPGSKMCTPTSSSCRPGLGCSLRRLQDRHGRVSLTQPVPAAPVRPEPACVSRFMPTYPRNAPSASLLVATYSSQSASRNSGSVSFWPPRGSAAARRYRRLSVGDVGRIPEVHVRQHRHADAALSLDSGAGASAVPVPVLPVDSSPPSRLGSSRCRHRRYQTHPLLRLLLRYRLGPVAPAASRSFAIAA